MEPEIIIEEPILDKKARLEIEKLELENKKLKSKWVIWSQYLSSILPITLAFGTLIFAIASGLLDVKANIIKYEKFLNQSEIVILRN